MKQKGVLLVVSGPSGAGKGTICSALLAKYDTLCYSVSATTRAPRVGEVDGKDYFFVSKTKFAEMIENNQFLEYAKVYDNYYGTPKEYVEKKLHEGFDVLLEIEMDGAQQIREKFPDGILVYIMPPSLGELHSRIKKRDKDSEEIIKKRMLCAAKEIKRAVDYDYIVLNNKLDNAVEETYAIILAEKLKTKRSFNIIDKVCCVE